MPRQTKILAVLLTVSVYRLAALDLPPVLDFGRIPYDRAAHRSVKLANESELPVYMDFVSTCPCVTVTPASLTVPAGGEETVDIAFDPLRYGGEVEKIVVVRSSIEAYDRSLLRIWALVDRPPGAAAEGCLDCEIMAEAVQEQGFRRWLDANWLVLDVYYTEGCHDCEELIGDTIPRLARELSLRVSVRRHNVLDPAQYELLLAETERRGVEITGFPIVTVTDALLAGNNLSPSALKEAMERAAGRPVAMARERTTATGERPNAGPSEREPIGRLAVVPVLAAGLVDGVNPCAFATLLFLLSSLAVVGRNRREILAIGAVFAAAVFGTYFAVGLGLFHALRAATHFPIVAKTVRVLMAGVLLVFSLLSVWDWRLVRRGEASKMVLQLPDSFKKRIHDSVRRGVRGYGLVAGALTMGVAVSIFELGCTGQVYLPTISYMVQSGRGGHGLLALYNLGFIAPLLALFSAVYLGIGSDGLLRLFRANLGRLKLVLAAAFAGLAALTLLT